MSKLTQHGIQILLEGLTEGQGATLKNFEKITYKAGFQVGIEGLQTRNIEFAVYLINSYRGNCGVWLSNNIYFIDETIHVSRLDTAVSLGKDYNQESIYDWKNDSLVWLEGKEG